MALAAIRLSSAIMSVDFVASPVINPYLAGAGLIARRLWWDLHPEAFRSRRRLRSDKDAYRGRKAVILCNGPSLLKTDFGLLAASGVFTFGLNKINLIFDKADYRPDAIVAVNPYVLQQNRDFYNETDIPLYVDSCALRIVDRRENVTFLHSTSIRRFARDCSMSINQGFTVTFVALQLAYHLGFTEVALIGCDHDFAQKGPANKLVRAGARDDSHFDPNYFAPGMPWQLPDLVQSELGYLLAREAYETSGRAVVNCTAGGKLEIFARQGLADFLAAESSVQGHE
jgi:hypothetical protein